MLSEKHFNIFLGEHNFFLLKFINFLFKIYTVYIILKIKIYFQKCSLGIVEFFFIHNLKYSRIENTVPELMTLFVINKLYFHFFKLENLQCTLIAKIYNTQCCPKKFLIFFWESIFCIFKKFITINIFK